jgi:hypothetical protein
VKIAKEIMSIAKILTGGMNIKNTPLSKAREYAESEFEKAGKNLDKEIPEFDKNYNMLQGKMSKAKNIPRIQMPVIEPSDMALFNKRLNDGKVDIFEPYARGKFWMPTSLSKDEAGEWIELGYADGNKGDDVVKGKIGKTPVGKLLPLQGEIWLDKVIQNLIKFGIPGSGSPLLSATVIVSKDRYILDGHHRYGQAMIANPSLALKTLTIPLPIDLLLKVGKTYGEAIGNKPKK